MDKPNKEIRELIQKKGIRHFEAAQACKVSQYTFSHWLQIELSPEKKKQVIQAIEKL